MRGCHDLRHCFSPLLSDSSMMLRDRFKQTGHPLPLWTRGPQVWKEFRKLRIVANAIWISRRGWKRVGFCDNGRRKRRGVYFQFLSRDRRILWIFRRRGDGRSRRSFKRSRTGQHTVDQEVRSSQPRRLPRALDPNKKPNRTLYRLELIQIILFQPDTAQ